MLLCLDVTASVQPACEIMLKAFPEKYRVWNEMFLQSHTGVQVSTLRLWMVMRISCHSCPGQNNYD